MTSHRLSTASSGGSLGDLVHWLSPRRRRQLALLFALMLAGAIAELAAIGAVLPFLRLVVAPDAVFADTRMTGLRTAFGWRTPGDLIIPAAALLIGCAVAAAAVRMALAWASQRFVYRLSYDMDAALFARAVHQPYVLHIGGNSSELLAGFDKVNVLTNTVLLPMMQGVAAGVIAAFIVALLVWVDPFTAAITAGAVGLPYAIVAIATRRPLREASRERARLATSRITVVREGLEGLRDIILDRSQAFHQHRFAAINGTFRTAAAQAAIIAAAPRFVVEAAGVALIGALAVHFSRQPGGLVAAVPVLGAMALGAQRLLPLFQASYAAWVQYAAARASLSDVLALMRHPAIPHAPADVAGPPPFRREIVLAGVGFGYAGRAAAVAYIDLSIAAGERIGLVGRTGSGKSTLVDVLMGLLPPTEGAILLDGVPLTTDRVGAWQGQIAHVPQTVFLADDSIAANIALGEAGTPVDMTRVAEAARLAQLHDVIAELPEGYATAVGERGIRLSGGQRQRIGIARALYKRADVLVLDEATSALDDATEAAIMAAIDALPRAPTVIVIAHRLSTLAACTTVYRLEGGRIVERGSYAQVIGGK